MSGLRRLLVRILVAVGAAFLVVGTILAVGDYLRKDLHDRDRYQSTISEIDCDPPSGLGRAEFLAEVHYYGQMPERFSTLDRDLSEKLTAAFLKHPRVKRVDRVTILPSHQVHVELTFKN